MARRFTGALAGPRRSWVAVQRGSPERAFDCTMAYVANVRHTDGLAAFLRDVGQHLRTTELSGVREKSPLDVVSDLDFWAEGQISEYLRRHYPGDAILSEETATNVEYVDRIWVLDPLDGTVNRTSEIPYFAISLALLEHGSPTLGWVYDPVHDEMYSAVAGQGAYLNGSRLQVAQAGVRGISLTSGLIQRMAESNPQALVELLSSHGKLRNFGAYALQLAYVAAGRLSAAASTETRLWDNLAGALLVREAGGHFTDLTGEDPFPLQAGHPALRGAANPNVAAAASVHPPILRLFNSLSVLESGPDSEV